MNRLKPLRTGEKPSLGHLHVWGCLVEARIYNPQERKLDLRLSMGILLDILKGPKVLDFTVQLIQLNLLKLEMPDS